MIKNSIVLLLMCSVLWGCNEVNPKGEREVVAFIKKWNNKHTPIKATNLKHDYLDVVHYYGAEVTKERVQQDKNQLFVRFPDYKQEIIDSSITIEEEGKTYLVSFDRKVAYDEKSEKYASFISVIYKNGEFNILREGLDPVGVDLNKNTRLFPTQQTLNDAFRRSRRLYGDFNGDGLSEYATVLFPETAVDNPERNGNAPVCEDGCMSTIQFSNTAMAPIEIDSAYGGSLENLRDLNDDGSDELGFFSEKPSSKTLYIFDASTGRLLTAPIEINTSVHKNMKLIDILKKTGPKKITVTRSILEGNEWTLKSEVIRLQ